MENLVKTNGIIESLAMVNETIIKIYCGNVIRWFDLWAAMRALRNIIAIQTKRIDALEKNYYSTNGG